MMQTNVELEQAWEFVEHTGTSVFLTGKAGTGKTTFLRSVVEKSQKRLVVVAPTGVAAINARGVTIHSFFQLPFSPYIPNTIVKGEYGVSKEKRNIIRTLDLLIIDEISMVRSDLLDAIDSVLRRFKNPMKPFGGVQLLMMGDLQQLTPVVTEEDAGMLKSHYSTPYFFGSHALSQIPYVTIELKHVYRQQDVGFLHLLNHVREGRPTAEDMQQLNARFHPDFRSDADQGYIRLTTHNAMADHYNDSQLAQLQTPSFDFKAEINGVFPEYSYPTNEVLTLKKGAQVMFVKNDSSPLRQYYNGRIGRVKRIDQENIIVHCPGDDFDITVGVQEWENTRYVINKETKEIEPDVQGSFRQYPLRLAWAITIHKSQGLTFEHAIIDAGLSFASGQVYVALSRCKTLEGLVLASRIDEKAIINDQRVNDYISRQEEEAHRSISLLELYKQDYYKQLLVELFSFHDILRAQESLCRAAVEWLHAYPKLTLLHKSTLNSLQKQVGSVAIKWLSVIQQSNYDQLTEGTFLDRVKRSAGYFNATLNTYIRPLIAQTRDIKIENKHGAERLQATFDDLYLAYLTKHYLLDEVCKRGFDVGCYLKMRQTTFLDALDEVAPQANGPRRRRKSKSESAAPKPKREDTKLVSRRMFDAGKTVGDIAVARSLTVATIENHLAYYVEQGELEAVDIIGKERYKAVNGAIHKLRTTVDMKTIKELCPSEVTYGDIKVVLAEKNRRASTAS